MLAEAILATSRGYLFDNSGEQAVLPTRGAVPSTPVFKSTSCTLPPSHLQRAKQVPLLRAMLPHAEQHVI